MAVSAIETLHIALYKWRPTKKISFSFLKMSFVIQKTINPFLMNAPCRQPNDSQILAVSCWPLRDIVVEWMGEIGKSASKCKDREILHSVEVDDAMTSLIKRTNVGRKFDSFDRRLLTMLSSFSTIWSVGGVALALCRTGCVEGRESTGLHTLHLRLVIMIVSRVIV